MHAHTCTHMYAKPMQTYIFHPNMKIIKIKASYLYEKTATKIYKWTVLVIYFAYKVFESAYIYTRAL